MAYGDEEVISARIALLRNKENSIDRTATIDGVDYSFSQREFPLGFSMIVPNSFDTLAPKLARIKYPYEDRLSPSRKTGH